MDLSLISDLFLLTHPFSKVPSPFPTPGCVLCIHFPILVVVEDTICPKAFANPGIESLPPPVAAKSCWWDLEGRIFRDGEQCTHSVAVLCHWLFPISSGFSGVIQDRLCCLFGSSHFLRLCGVVLAMIPFPAVHSREWMQRLVSQAWLKDGRQVPHWGLLHPLPRDNPDQWLLSYCSISRPD